MVLLSLLHLISYRLKIVFSPRYTRLAPFLPWVTKLVSLFLINLPHQTLCLCGKLKHLQEQVKVSTIVRFTWHFCICGGKRGKEKVEKWALMQEPASTTWWSIGRGTCMEVVRNRETHAGRSAAVKMIMASQITGPHLSSSNSLSNHTALRLQQPTPSSSRVSVEPTRRNCPAYCAGKAPPSTFKYNYIRLRIQ